ncbi:MAG: response regulator [Elusimicrobia bacterium]|nr:response regulator [Elusimicrobiota bacterium]
MKPRILIADDDAGVAAVIARVLEPVGCELQRAATGPEALAAAAASAPDLVLLDVRMPGLSGWGVLARLRGSAATRTTPVVMLTGCGEVGDKVEGFGLGADDYVTKPFSGDELRARVFGLLRRHRETLHAHPLTGLPGSPSIEAEVERRIAEKLPFAFFHADIDRFKSFNDAYGYERGDRTIAAAALALRRGVERAGDLEGFVGHVGGDDFALVCSEARAAIVADLAVQAFDESVPVLHDPADAERGWYEAADRRGTRRRFPLLSLTLGGVSTRRRRLDRYAKAVALASEMKAWLKSRRETGPSAWDLDRRTDAPEAHA